MKTLADQSFNRVNIVGKLLDVTFREGTLKTDGRAYESATMTIRVTQTYGGREETSDIVVPIFAPKYTKNNTINPGWEHVQNLKKMKSAQNAGIDAADVIRINSGTLGENYYISKSGQLISTWQIRTSFLSSGAATDVAAFVADIFIMDMHPELDREGDPTGRLIVKGALVAYGGKVEVIEFIVESPDHVDFVERHWNNNDTVTVKGRIRWTVKEQVTESAEDSWGEDIPEVRTTAVRELIITKGSDEGKEEEFAYSPEEIKKGFNARKAAIEQLQLNAKNSPAKKAETSEVNKYSWE